MFMIYSGVESQTLNRSGTQNSSETNGTTLQIQYDQYNITVEPAVV